MTRRGAIVACLASAGGVLVEGALLAAPQQRTAPQWATTVLKREPPWLQVPLGGERGLSKLVVVGPDGERITLTPEQIMAALRGD